MARIFLLLLAFPSIALAEGGAIENPLKSDSIGQLLGVFLDGVVRLGVIALVLALVWAGFQFIAAQGNQEKLTNARTTLMWTIVGGAILLGAKLIAGIIEATVTSL